MRTLLESETHYLAGAHAEFKRLLTALGQADIDAPHGTTQSQQDHTYDRLEGRIVATIRSQQLQDLVVELQQQRLADVQGEIIAAFTPFFDSPERCRLAAQGTDAFGREQRRLSAIQRMDVDGAKAAIAVIGVILGAE